MKYSSEIDKGVIISYERMLNDILNEFSKKYNKCFYTKYDDYEMRDVLYYGKMVIYALEPNEHFTGYLIRKELDKFCETHLKKCKNQTKLKGRN